MNARFSGRFTYIVVVPGKGSFETNSRSIFKQYTKALDAKGIAYQVV